MKNQKLPKAKRSVAARKRPEPNAADAALKAFAKSRGETQALVNQAQAPAQPNQQVHQEAEPDEVLVATPVPPDPAASPEKPKRLSGRPKGSKTKVLVPEIVEQAIPLLEGFDEKEMKFIKMVLTTKCTTDEAMVSAGYGKLEETVRCQISTQIIQKYEQCVGDGRKIMRAAGVGELAVALKIKEMMNDSSKTIQAKGVELAGKYLGMSKETLQIEHGITIVIKGSDRGQATPGAPPGRPKGEEPKALPGPTPISITR